MVLRMRLVVDRIGLGFVVYLIFDAFVAAVHAVVAANTRILVLLEKHGFSPEKRR